jgi:uncharacterized protein YdgA (DUF945 family)
LKRIVAIIVLLLVIAVLATPFLVGMRVEKRFMEWVATANKEVQSQWGDQSSVKVVEYQRGWLRSRAKVEAELRLEKPNEPPHTLAFTNSVTIEHGPLPGILNGERREGWAWLHSQAKATEVLAALATLDEDPQELEPLRKALADYPPVELQMRLAFDGTSDWSVRAGPYRIAELACCSQLSWSPLIIQGQAAADFAASRGTLTLDRVQIEGRDDNSQLVVEGFGADFDTERHVSGLDLGKVKWTLRKLTLHSEQGQLQITGLSISADSEANGEALDNHLSVQLDSGEGTGPDGVPHTVSGDCRFALNGLDLVATAKFVKAVQAMNGEAPDPTAEAKLQQLVTTVVRQSLKYDPSISIDPLNLTLDGQKVNGELKLGLTGAGSADLIAHPEELVRYLQGRAHLSVPETLALSAVETFERQQIEQVALERELNATTEEQQTPPAEPDPEQAKAMARQVSQQLIAGLVGQGLIRREGANLITEVELEPGGKLTVNGKPMAVPLLGQ